MCRRKLAGGIAAFVGLCMGLVALFPGTVGQAFDSWTRARLLMFGLLLVAPGLLMDARR